jgi:KaiC/GvpD/RAD55 family RecA-like ATPase
MLAVAAIISFLLTNWDFLAGPQPILEAATWIVPLLTAIAVSAVVVYLKWDPFLTDKGSKHFVTSFASLGISIIVLISAMLKQADLTDIDFGLWIYPASIIGVCLSLISIAMIWEGMSRRKTTAIASALGPLVIMLLTVLVNPADIYGALPLVFLGSAVCIQLSGSMMHLIATSTSLQQREILKAGDAKIIQIKEEAQKIKDQLAFKEQALMEREIGFASIDHALSDLRAELDIRERQLRILEEDQAKREMQLREEKGKSSAAILGLSHREEILQQKDLELSSKEKELEAITLALQSKEEQLRIQTDQLQQDQTALRVSEKQFNERKELIGEEMDNLRAAREALMAEQKKIADKNKEMQLRESSLDMRLREAGSPKASAQDIKRLKEWEEKLLQKEEMLIGKEMDFKDKMREPEQLMRQAELKMASADERINEVEDKEKEVLAREAAAERLEKEIISGREDLQQKMMEIDTLRQEAATKKTKYDALMERLSKRTEEIAKREEMIRAGSTTIETRERSIAASTERMQKEKVELETQRRSLIELEKRISAKESGMQSREVQMLERQKEMEMMMRSGAAMPGATEDLEGLRQREKALELRERTVAEKESDLRRKAYASSKGETAESEEMAAEIPAAGKIGTGTKRLDDLLIGGFPQGSSVLFVGPPYTGKEVGIMSFLAEGMKKGIPAVIVTTSKNPNDLIKEFAPILPTLLDVEQLGLVRWIDATPESSHSKEMASQRKHYIKVDGPDDLPGIIEAVEKMTEDVRNDRFHGFKLGYLSLSMSISHTDEMEATKFIQAITRNVRDLDSSAVFALEKGMHSEQQVESIQHLMDGAIMIKLDKQKTYLSVMGIGEVQSRDWIEFKHTSAGLIIGAFSLERIR